MKVSPITQESEFQKAPKRALGYAGRNWHSKGANMRVDKTQSWAFASRDLFKATECEHCVRLSMAVKAQVPSVLEKIEPFIEDLAKKLPIIQGNQRERIVFDQIKASLPEGDFVELERSTVEETVATMRRFVPVIAQGYFVTKPQGYEWSGYADLLVLEGYDLAQLEDGTIAASKTGEVADEPKYMPWDIKNSSEGDEKYQIQLAGYLDALEQLGMASQQPMGIVLSFSKGIVKYEPEPSMTLYRDALSKLVAILKQTTPATITDTFVTSWSCLKKSVCADIYCDYPRLCAKTFKENRVLELLPKMHHTHSPKLRAAGIATVSDLASLSTPPEVTDLKAEFTERYWRASRVMQIELGCKKALMSNIAGSPALPAPTPQDVFFDIEWFNPVDSNGEFIFMFGVVSADESFEAFIADEPKDELEQFDKFLDFGLDRSNANPAMHIYHYHNPEPLKIAMLVNRYGGHRAADAEALIARMVDLRPIAMDAFIPGSGSYSIKSLENYYNADSKLHRDKLVSGGADAMYQFELFRVASASGARNEARDIMKVIFDYNRDDCLSTKLLVDWLRSLEFDAVDQIVTWP
jgi:uncharacterized protein